LEESTAPSAGKSAAHNSKTGSQSASKSKPIPFTCPACEAEYKIVAIEVRDVQQGRIACLNCDALFPAGEGRVAFKYFLVRRPSGRKPK
jgi:transcription elongation factor Elf1